MRILYAANFFLGFHRRVGGAESALADVLALARDAGLTVAAAARRPDIEPPPGAPSFHRIRTVEDWNRRRPFYELDRLKFGGFCLDPLAYWSFRRILRSWQPDVVHFGNLSQISFAAVKAARRAGVPAVFTVYDYWLCCPRETLLDQDDRICRRLHGPWCRDCLRATRPLKLAEELTLAHRARWFRRWLGQMDRVVVLSEHCRGIVTQAGVPAARIAVIPLPHALRPVAPAASPTPGRLLYVGWIQRRKGLHVLLTAMFRVWAEMPEAVLRVVGDSTEPAYLRELEALLARHGCRDRVQFVGRLPRAAVQEELAQAWAVAVPEQWENVSPVILGEAIVAGAPVVASRIGGIPELVADGVSGLCPPPDQPEAWAAALLRVLREPGLRERLAVGARAALRARCDPAAVAAQWLELYRQLISGKEKKP